MAGYVARRLAQGVLTVFVAVTIAFALIHIAPGEPFAGLLEDPRVTPEIRAGWRLRFGLDEPILEQYVRFLASAVRGDFGTSFSHQQPVREVLAAALPNTLLLMSVALVAGFGVGIVLGAAQGARAGGWFDRLTGGAALVVSALPEFWLGLVALLLFAARWPLFPVSGMTDAALHAGMSPLGRIADVARHLALPAGTLALVIGAAVSRFQRAALLETLPDDYVRAARARGLSRRRVLFRHALRNALLPTITLGGLAAPALLGGAVFIEQIFGWPGMGRLAVEAVQARDYPLVLAAVLVSSALVVLGGLAADLLHAAADPRVRHA